jgi:sortase B
MYINKEKSETTESQGEAKRGRSISDYLRGAVVLVCAVVFIVCCVMIVDIVIDYMRADSIYAVATTDTPDQILASMTENYPDVFSYIEIESVDIAYPVTITDNNEYYLKRAYNGEELKSGSIFADYRCSREIGDNRNLVLYGHNMSNGGMFHNVEQFNNEETFNNSLIKIYSQGKIYIYKPISFFSTTSTFQYFRTSFSSDDDFLAFANEMKAKSKHSSDIEIMPDTKLLTISTCTNLTLHGRYALHAALIEVEE